MSFIAAHSIPTFPPLPTPSKRQCRLVIGRFRREPILPPGSIRRAASF